jgi:hypothetical protein
MTKDQAPMTKQARKSQIQNGLPTLESEVALQDFESALDAGKPKGRPKGAKNREVDCVDAPPTSCQKCGSTRRTPYFNRRAPEISGVCPLTGQAYTSIVYRRTSCADCGQFRDDRTLVNEK